MMFPIGTGSASFMILSVRIAGTILGSLVGIHEPLQQRAKHHRINHAQIKYVGQIRW